MKILTISNMYPSKADPVYGTFVKNFHQNTTRLNRGGETHLVTIYGRRNGKLAKIKTYAAFYSQLTATLLRKNYDLVYVHTITFPTPALRLATIFKRLPVVFHIHGDDLLPQTRMKKLLKRSSFPLIAAAKSIIVPSSYYRDVLIREIPGIEPDKIFISPSGGVNEKFYHYPQKLSIPETPIIGYISRIDKGKGWDTLLNALHMLRRQNVKFTAKIAGNGPQVDKLSATIKQLGLEDCVEYLGAVEPKKLPELYRTFNIFIFPTTRPQESLGLVGLEAMASGVPVIASNMAGPTTYITDGQDGMLFTPGNPESLTEKIKEWYSLDPENKLTLARNAYQTAMNYKAEDVAVNLHRHLEKICEENRKR